jgi:hypothetical protein
MAMSSLTYIPIMEIDHILIKDHPLKPLNQIKRLGKSISAVINDV